MDVTLGRLARRAFSPAIMQRGSPRINAATRLRPRINAFYDDEEKSQPRMSEAPTLERQNRRWRTARFVGDPVDGERVVGPPSAQRRAAH